MNTTGNELPKLLFVDDEVSVLNALRRSVRRYSWDCEFCENPEQAMHNYDLSDFDVIVSDMRMPKVDGAQFLTHCLEQSPDTTRILLTGYSDMDKLADAVNSAKIYNYITKPWDQNLLAEILENAITTSLVKKENQYLHRLLKKQNDMLQRTNQSLEEQVDARTKNLRKAIKAIEFKNKTLAERFEKVVSVLVNLIDHKDGCGQSHSHNVVELSILVAEQLGLADKDLDDLRVASTLHDIGQLGISDLPNKAINHYSDAELKLYQKHCFLSETLLAGLGANAAVCEIVRNHHEKLDGSGFPSGLSRNQLSLSTKILSVVSDFCDLNHGKLMGHISGIEASLKYLSVNGKNQYDQQVVAVLQSILETTKTGFCTERLVKVSEAKEKTILARDLVSDSGLLLLRAGQQLTASILERLKRYEREMNTVLSIIVSDSHQNPNSELYFGRTNRIA